MSDSTKPDTEVADYLARYGNVGFEDFRRMAADDKLSAWEKIGFPDSYRKGLEQDIFLDIARKLPALDGQQQIIIDIGAGCSDLPRKLIDRSIAHRHRLILVDSAEMLGLLPDGTGVEKVAARFPDCPTLIASLQGRVNAVLVYSVFQYVFAEGNTWAFLDACLSMLAPGGSILIGDIPNISRRKRFFASETGIAHHKQFTGRDESPTVSFNRLEPAHIDDAVIMGLIMRCRNAGFDAWVVPQDASLPMANRREDILITRP
ncbi:class I SAM-dependent methyltransferase [Uliginosibacterium sp. H3]|uniref:Class I SAM-dependent methyltransferase n=1 Tax=Uliginosibacterium silvisoli TaxID=3114758 RepID=A0ABU6K9D6_9RHOO|nr:class I SAM-dependent methyltransferase [Uliginosibacterium sp. H3]